MSWGRAVGEEQGEERLKKDGVRQEHLHQTHSFAPGAVNFPHGILACMLPQQMQTTGQKPDGMEGIHVAAGSRHLTGEYE